MNDFENLRLQHNLIAIITKPGSPRFHGEANFLDRDSVFHAENYFSPVRPTESRRIYEGHAQGPAARGEHTSFIASWSYRQQDTAAVVNAIGPQGAIVENVLTPNPDSAIPCRCRMIFRPHTDFPQVTTMKAVAAPTPALAPSRSLRRASTKVPVRMTPSSTIASSCLPTLSISCRSRFEKDRDVTTSVTDAQSIKFSGAFVGGGAQADVSRTENTIHVNELVTWSHGKHYLRAGVQLPQFSRRAVDDHTHRLGSFKVSSLAAYAGNAPYVFTAQQGVGRGLYWINEFGAFVQDEVKLSPRLQLSVGLRYDWQAFLRDNNNLAPRVSLSYAPQKGKTILRVGAGVFYDRTGGDFPSTVKLHNGDVLKSIQVQNPSYPSAALIGSDLPTNIARSERTSARPTRFNIASG